MAVYFAPPDRSGSAGIGASIGEGLGKTLMMLTQNKMLQQQQQQQMQQQMQMQEQAKQQKAFDVAQGLSAMGVPEEVSEQIAFMPESQQNMFLKQFFGSEAFGAAQGGQTGQLEEGMQTLEGAAQVPGQTDQLEQLLGPQREPVREEAPIGAQQAPAEEPDYTEITKQIQDRVNQLSPEDKAALKQEIKQAQAVPEGASKEAKPGYRLQAKPTARKSFRELLSTPRPNAADNYKAEALLMRRESLDMRRRKDALAEQKNIDIKTKKFYEETMSAGKAARDNDMRLNKMSKHIESGRMPPAALYSLLETVNKGIFGFGINLKGTLLSKKAQNFEKLTADFAKGAKDVFGSRLSTKEVELYMKSIPNLSQSDAGKKSVIKNWKIMNQAATVRKKAMMDIIEMNGGERPPGLGMLVEKKVGPKLDQLADAFTGKKKKKKKSSGVFGTIFGGVESARKYLNPSR